MREIRCIFLRTVCLTTTLFIIISWMPKSYENRSIASNIYQQIYYDYLINHLNDKEDLASNINYEGVAFGSGSKYALLINLNDDLVPELVIFDIYEGTLDGYTFQTNNNAPPKTIYVVTILTIENDAVVKLLHKDYVMEYFDGFGFQKEFEFIEIHNNKTSIDLIERYKETLGNTGVWKENISKLGLKNEKIINLDVAGYISFFGELCEDSYSEQIYYKTDKNKYVEDYDVITYYMANGKPSTKQAYEIANSKFEEGTRVSSLHNIKNRDAIIKLLQAADNSIILAKPLSSKVFVNNRLNSFDIYTINGNNYFRLRDFAYSVNNTNKQFDVLWDRNQRVINLSSNKPYTKVGGEMMVGNGAEKIAVLNSSRMLKDGLEISLISYSINGNNYFKLRDIAKAFDIGVIWDSDKKTIEIDTGNSYVEP